MGRGSWGCGGRGALCRLKCFVRALLSFFQLFDEYKNKSGDNVYVISLVQLKWVRIKRKFNNYK